MHDRLANTVEKEEGITAGLWVSWATHFCQDAEASLGRSSGGNGGRLRCCAAGGKKCNWGWRLGRAGVGWLQDASGLVISRLPQRSPKPPAIAAGASPSPSSRVLAKTRCPAYPKPRHDPLFLFHRVRELIVHRYGSIADLFPTTALSDLAGVALLAASAPRVLPFPPLARFRS